MSDFNPAMLKLARECRWLAYWQIARIMGGSVFRARQLETKWGKPSPDELKRLSERLDFPEDFFRQESDPIMNAPVFMCKINYGDGNEQS